MQRYALSDTAGAKAASTDAITQASTMPAAATAAQLNTEALTKTAAPITMQAAVTHSSANSRSEAEHNYFKEINKGCVNNTTFVPEGLLPHFEKNGMPNATNPWVRSTMTASTTSPTMSTTQRRPFHTRPCGRCHAALPA